MKNCLQRHSMLGARTRNVESLWRDASASSVSSVRDNEKPLAVDPSNSRYN